MLDAVRAICLPIVDKNSIDYIPTGAFREKLGFRKKHLFSEEVKVIRTNLIKDKFNYQLIFFDLHIALGCREGSTDTESGATGLRWDRFHKNYHFVDDYECKTRQGV